MRKQDYYILVPIDEESLRIDIPVNNKKINIRHLIEKDDVIKIIDNIPNIEVIEIGEKLLENEYRKLLNSDNHYDLVRIIKTTYLRNKKRIDDTKNYIIERVNIIV